MLVSDHLRLRTMGQKTVHQQPRHWITLAVQKIKHLLLTVDQSDLVRIRIERKRPLIDCSASPLMANRRKVGRLAYTVREATPILHDQLLRKCQIAQSRCEKDIRF